MFYFMNSDLAWNKLKEDQVLGPVVLKWGKCPLQPQLDYFSELCDSVLSQQISGKVATKILARLKEYCGGKLTPDKISYLETNELRNLGVSERKAKTLIDLAQRCLNGSIQLEHFARLRKEDITQSLTQVKGIGIWTVNIPLRLYTTIHILPMLKKTMKQRLMDFSSYWMMRHFPR